jgi:hypothetical protein
MQFVKLGFVVGSALGFFACDGEDPLSQVEGASAIENGHNLNGHNLNGHNLNGHNLNGESELGDFVKWVSYRNATLGTSQLKNVHLEGSQIVGTVNHHRVSGTQLVGARFDAMSDTSEDLELQITGAFAPGPNEDPTTWRYTVEYRETDGIWVPICLNDTTQVPAIPVDGYWDLDEGQPGDGGKIKAGQKFLFACEQVGAIGKCVEAGYRPWQKVDHQSLDRYHQTCVRLLRADFCGTSVSYTVDGSLVNIYDKLGIQLDTEDWAPEAEWDKSGARCISPDATTANIDDVPCLDDLLRDNCALSFHHHTLLISERP